MVVTVNRNAVLREVEKRPETSEIRAKALLQIIEEMEARTREALELARELEEFFGSAIAAMNTIRETEESVDSQS